MLNQLLKCGRHEERGTSGVFTKDASFVEVVVADEVIMRVILMKGNRRKQYRRKASGRGFLSVIAAQNVLLPGFFEFDEKFGLLQ